MTSPTLTGHKKLKIHPILSSSKSTKGDAASCVALCAFAFLFTEQVKIDNLQSLIAQITQLVLFLFFIILGVDSEGKNFILELTASFPDQ